MMRISVLLVALLLPLGCTPHSPQQMEAALWDADRGELYGYYSTVTEANRALYNLTHDDYGHPIKTHVRWKTGRIEEYVKEREARTRPAEAP